MITLEAEDLSGGLSSSKIVLEMLLLKSVVQVCKRNMADVMHLVTALNLILIAQAQSTFLTAFEKVRRIIGCCALFLFHMRKEISVANTAFHSKANLYVRRAFKSGYI